MQAAAGPAGALAALALCLLLSVGARGVVASPATVKPHNVNVTNMTKGTNVTATGPRIVGGRNAKPGEFPWQVSVRTGSGSHFCGGAVLNATTVVTAAHCVYQRPVEFIQAMSVMGGSILQSRPGATADVLDALVHPDYGNVYQEYDIALLFLAKALPLGADIWPVQLQEHELPEGTLCVASGWGRTVDSKVAPIPDNLQAVDLPIIDAKKCNDMYMEEDDYSPVIESQICAGYVEGGKDSCQGDSGGPLVCTNRRLLTGIVSWGAGCAQPGRPGVYSDVSFLLSWIKENVVLDDQPQPSTPDDNESTTKTSDATPGSSVRGLLLTWAVTVALLSGFGN